MFIYDYNLSSEMSLCHHLMLYIALGQVQGITQLLLKKSTLEKIYDVKMCLGDREYTAGSPEPRQPSPGSTLVFSIEAPDFIKAA